MKNVLTIISFCVSYLKINAQWTTSGSNIYSSNAGNVGIASTTPGQKFTVSGGIRLDDARVFNGVIGDGHPALSFGISNTGEGIGSKRVAGVNQYGLDGRL